MGFGPTGFFARPTMSKYTDEAERNGNGELIYEKIAPAPMGGTKTIEVNMTKLYQPGPRKTSNIARMVEEARLVADGVELGNPLRPSNDEAAKEAVERLDELDLIPAWRTAEEVTFP